MRVLILEIFREGIHIERGKKQRAYFKRCRTSKRAHDRFICHGPFCSFRALDHGAPRPREKQSDTALQRACGGRGVAAHRGSCCWVLVLDKVLLPVVEVLLVRMVEELEVFVLLVPIVPTVPGGPGGPVGVVGPRGVRVDCDGRVGPCGLLVVVILVVTASRVKQHKRKSEHKESSARERHG